jgi:hypothetical protein
VLVVTGVIGFAEVAIFVAAGVAGAVDVDGVVCAGVVVVVAGVLAAAGSAGFCGVLDGANNDSACKNGSRNRTIRSVRYIRLFFMSFSVKTNILKSILFENDNQSTQILCNPMFPQKHFATYLLSAVSLQLL